MALRSNVLVIKFIAVFFRIIACAAGINNLAATRDYSLLYLEQF
jgi:hypothetical protein